MGTYKDTHGKTRIGDALADLGDIGKPILKILSKVSIPGAALLGEVSNAIRSSQDIDQDTRARLMGLLQMDLADLDSARTSNANIQQSQFSSWMAKNVPYIIDCFVLLIWGVMTVFIIAKAFNMIKDMAIDWTPILGIYSGVTAMATQIISFHRGSSAGSRLKDILNKKEP